MTRLSNLTIILVVAIMLALVQAQRPPYAGSRPSGYKDRFRPRPTGGASTVANDIDNRFGENANNLDNSTNVTQRPPVGVDIVYGEPSDPNGQSSDIANDTEQQQGDTIVDRLGVQLGGNDQQSPQQGSPAAGIDQNSTENSTNDLFAGGSQEPLASGISSRPTVFPIRQTTFGHVPYDAHGDVPLVNLLNQRPVNQQPFWFVNYQAIEAHRNGTTS